VFRAGTIEAVEAHMLRRGIGEDERFIPSLALERELIDATERYLRLMRELEISPPYLLGLTLLEVKGLRLGVSQRLFELEESIDRDNLLIPELLVEESNLPAATTLKPAIDAIWQAAGWAGSTNYDSNGVWHDR
jgi:hypothetical protein